MPSFPLTGSHGLVRLLPWYFEDTPTSADRLAGSLRSPSNTCIASRPFAPPGRRRIPGEPGALWFGDTRTDEGNAGDGRPPRFLGNPHDSSPGAATPVGPTRQAIRRVSAAPAFANSEGSRRAERFRGSISRLSVWLSTLRGVGRPYTPRKTRCRLVANLCRAGLSPAGFAIEGFR